MFYWTVQFLVHVMNNFTRFGFDRRHFVFQEPPWLFYTWFLCCIFHRLHDINSRAYPYILLAHLLDSLRILSLSDVAWDGSLLFTARVAFLSSSLGKTSSEYTLTQSSLADDLSPYFLPYTARMLVSIWCIYLSTCIEVMKLQPEIMCHCH